jgi:hypothetical protein
MEHHEEQRRVAISIALQAGVVKRCEVHEDCVFDAGHDVVNAYELGNYKFKAGELGDTFDTPKEMTDSIKAAYEDHPGDECPRCAKLLAD